MYVRQRLRGHHRHLPGHARRCSGARPPCPLAASPRCPSAPSAGRSGLAQQSPGFLDLHSLQIKAIAYEGEAVSVRGQHAGPQAPLRWTGSRPRATSAATSCSATTSTPPTSQHRHSGQLQHCRRCLGCTLTERRRVHWRRPAEP